ncbi:IS4 transposase [Nostoc flagelliforme CCNUN1]|uniref:IS4 transposase n=1 Tax=Nostoc flagelliforme CCNUN1 TaxID=2038116 RepID=A0A2K8T3X3_9NOSO|nr:transposase [Nostoc flagelliforme]AUB41705.1 IS4 transposase [Nostoc flagelliforme CCNUN1]
MRIITKPSTAKCNLQIYILFLLCEPRYVSCVHLAKIMENLSHDSINRFLLREDYTPKDLFIEVSPQIELEGGTVSVDDMVIDKLYSDKEKAELIDYFWSGKHKKVVKGINIVTLYYTDRNGISVPANYRIVNKNERKTKHDYFLEMLAEVEAWGLKPSVVTGDSWYASKDNLNILKDKALSGLFALEANRLVSLDDGVYVKIKSLDIPQDGLMVNLKKVGQVKIFRMVFKNEFRYYAMFVPNPEKISGLSWEDFQRIHDLHWEIEQYHRALKQVCNIERFQVRESSAIRTHIFCAIRGFVQLEFLRFQGQILNWYSLQRNLFTEVIRSFILDNLAAQFLDLNNLEKIASF